MVPQHHTIERLGGGDQIGQGPGLEGHRLEDPDGFVEDADSARVVHVVILMSHYVRCQ